MVKILVVDDSSMDQKIAAGLLQKDSNWQVEFAFNGREAWERVTRADELPPDAVLTDLQMPEMDGLELVRKLRREQPLIPVILMTALGSESIAVAALQDGAASYVPKSRLASDLMETVQQVLAVAGERRSQKTLLRFVEGLRCSFVLENDPTLLTSLVTYLQSILRDMDVLAEGDRLRTGIALEEALLNAAYHGNLEVSSDLRENDHLQFYALAQTRAQSLPYRDRRVHIEVHIDPQGLKYVVRDEGPGFDPSKLPDPTDPANLERTSGRGVLLMRTFMDEVSYNERGNQVTMTKQSIKTTTST